MIKILLYRDWLNIKRNIFYLLVIIAMLPMLLHLFLSIPLSSLIKLDIRYLNWSAPGVWVTSSALFSFCFSLLRMKKIKNDTGQLDALLKTPLKNSEIILSIILIAVLLGFIQALFAITLTTLINNEYITFLQILFVLLQLIPLLVFYSIWGTFFGIFIKDGFSLVSSILLMFLFLAFSLGSFIPLQFFPPEYSFYIEKFPIYGIIHSNQMIIQNQESNYIGFFLTNFINVIFYLFTLMCTYKTFRK